MSELTEKVAQAMYWDRVNPDRGGIVLDVAVAQWAELPDEHRPGIQVWHCKSFWREAARAAILAVLAGIAEPSEAMMLSVCNEPFEGDHITMDRFKRSRKLQMWAENFTDDLRAMIAALRKEIANV